MSGKITPPVRWITTPTLYTPVLNKDGHSYGFSIIQEGARVLQYWDGEGWQDVPEFTPPNQVRKGD